MTTLVLATLGPVQDFIAQARRTRDLWFGSHVLSELSRAAARELATEHRARLIFPALDAGDLELDRGWGFLRRGGVPPVNVANKILAELPAGVDPEAALVAARGAAAGLWKDLSARVRDRLRPLLADDADRTWDEQVDTFLEFVGSWETVAGPADYDRARRAVERAVAARKNLREFAPWSQQHDGRERSSLDGARESVLLRWDHADKRPRDAERRKHLARLRIRDGERLDAVGLIKRGGGEPEQFVPVSNVALAAWIESADGAGRVGLAALRAACERAATALELTHLHRPDVPWVGRFPWEGQLFLPSRWESLFADAEDVSDLAPRAWAEQHVGPVLKAMGEPFPYVACLVADGDRMGKALDRLTSAEDHRNFSDKLARFARDARKVVERDHRGLLIYSGGDDVLALVCLPDAVTCAAALRVLFREVMGEALAAHPKVERPTLSVGVGIGHLMESLGTLLDLGRTAEKLAKSASLPDALSRNALGVVADRRSGDAVQWRARWETDPAEALARDIALLEGDRLPVKKLYEIRRSLAALPHWREVTAADAASWWQVLTRDVARTLGRVLGGAAALTSAEVGLVFPSVEEGYRASWEAVDAWCQRLLVARFLADASPRAKATRCDRNEEAVRP